MSQPISGFLFDREMQEAGFTRHEMSNQRLRDAAYRLLVRGRLYRFNDADEIEYGVSGPFNDDEGRAIAQPVEQTRALTEDARDAARYRWLRDPKIDVAKVIDKVTGEVPYDEGTRTGGYPIYEYRSGDDLDQAIDAALTAARPASGETE